MGINPVPNEDLVNLPNWLGLKPDAIAQTGPKLSRVVQGTAKATWASITPAAFAMFMA